MTGLVSPSVGDAYICNKSVLSQMHEIHRYIGVCPQEDIIWPYLTGREHLILFAKLKRIPRNMINDSVNEQLRLVGLEKRGDSLASKYSGGMKRRLSVAISFLGNPDVVFLDEPTSGLDPLNRRLLWEYIAQAKKNRLIVLTTHSMTEADALSDKIAILALGRLRAIGDPLHLKKKYGAGHHVNILCDDEKVDMVKENILKLLPDSTLDHESAGSLSYSIPLSRLKLFQQFLSYLEDHSRLEDEKPNGENFIRDWSISQTTLEEVFMRLTHGDSHTFSEKELSLTITYSLEIMAIDGSNLGVVKIDDDCSLADLREIIIEDIEIPSNEFYFFHDSIIPQHQERSIPAVKYIPQLTITFNSETSDNTLKKEDEEIYKAKYEKLNNEVLVLVEKLKESESHREELEKKLEKKRQKIKILKEKISKDTTGVITG